MPDITPKTQPIQILITIIQQEILISKQKIETEQITTYWKIGKHISQHIQTFGDRPDFGDYVFKTLATELNISLRLLYRAVQFYETYPKFVEPVPQITWSHYRILITIEDAEKRREYEQLVIEHNLSRRELQELVRKKIKKTHLKEKRGLPYIYPLKMVQTDNTSCLVVDLGFRTYLDLLDKENDYAEESIVQAVKGKYTYRFTLKEGIPRQMLFTFKGFVKEIVDGDTLWVNLDLGFNAWACKKVRLRGINAPGIETKSGIKARDFVVERLGVCEFVVVKTYWRDKFNRYLADIFYKAGEGYVGKVAGEGEFLNQELLSEGLVRGY